MFDERRREASVAYLLSLLCSIGICFVPMKTGLKIGLLVLRELLKELKIVVEYSSLGFI
jgi:hypothetical protein